MVESSSPASPPAQSNALGAALVGYADGGARGNPGPAAIGVLLRDGDGREVARFGRFIGRATNNQAEYRAAIAAIEAALALGASSLILRTDSELLARQLSGAYRTTNPTLRRLRERVEQLGARLRPLRIEQVRREDNKEADALVNAALDSAVVE